MVNVRAEAAVRLRILARYWYISVKIAKGFFAIHAKELR
jgi:hypothetical protein